MLGGFSNVEGVDLRERGENPVVTPVDQLGVPTYDELVLVASRKSLEETRRSSGSSWRRWRAARAAAANHPRRPRKRCWKRTPISTRS